MNPEQNQAHDSLQRDNSETTDYSRPVAYDATGRPLYAHPPTPAQPGNTEGPQVVHMMRPMEPAAPTISETAMAKHNASVQKYPHLNLSEGEYIISAVRRHPIGMAPIFAVLGISIIALAIGVAFYGNFAAESSSALPSVGAIALIAFLIALLFVIGGFIAVYVYVNNRFFLTNESVIQEIQQSLFSKHEQTVSLANIEDASYRQEGILSHLFNYGSIRLSTEGDETTYRFSYVANPKKHIAVLNNAVEAFKNGRPIEDN